MRQSPIPFKFIFLVFILLNSTHAFSQVDDDENPREPKVTYGIRLSVSSPHTWLLLKPSLNFAATFERKKNFYLLGLDILTPTLRHNDSETDKYSGWGFQFSYGRYLSKKNVPQGLYLLYNFRYQSIDDQWSIKNYSDGRPLWFETYESNFGAGLKSYMSKNLYFDIMAGAGFTINIDYANAIHVFTNPAIIVRGGIGYTFK